MRRIIWSAIVALIPVLAHASPASTPLYEIQVLVFANHMRSWDGHEHWQEEKNPPIKDLRAARTPSHHLPLGSQLAYAESILAQHPHYTILAARSWVQNTVSLQKTVPVRIKSERYGHLNGVIRVFRWKLLHVALNLRYRSPDHLTTNPSAPVYRLITQRPMAVARTNYFDNPKFGVLVRIVPYSD